MKFPDVTELGSVRIEGAGQYIVLLVKDDWEPDNGHDSDHARGGCECPCYPPLEVLRDAAVSSGPETA